MTPPTRPSFLRRYTDLPALLHLLRHRSLTLLDPRSWDDSNDSHYLLQYKEKRGLKSVLALCLSQAPETYHHWRVFSQGPAGVCIVFDRERLLAAALAHAGVTARAVAYQTLNEARRDAPQVASLPFVKRAAFRAENEFRLVFESATEALAAVDVPIGLDAIRSVSLSPWLHQSLAPATVQAIRAIPGCERLRVSRSTLIANEAWKALAERAG